MICPFIICFLYRNIIRSFTHYATEDSRGIAFIYKKLYRAVWWRITTNVFGCITEKNGRLFCCIATYFRGCNGIGDLLTRQARNFIYTLYTMFTFVPCPILLQESPAQEGHICLKPGIRLGVTQGLRLSFRTAKERYFITFWLVRIFVYLFSIAIHVTTVFWSRVGLDLI